MHRSPLPFIGLTVLLIGCNDARTVYKEPPSAVAVEEPSVSAVSSAAAENEAQASVPAAAPSDVSIEVPFSSQAPFSNWDDPYQEACEEMSLIMVQRFWTRQGLSREEADKELLAMVEWETEHGYGQDVNVSQLRDIAQEYYGLDAEVTDDVTIDRIKKELQAGYPVIIPAAGRELGNPNFSGEGPWYHMLVITGYDKTHFITNDPGTRKGEGYRYPYATLLNSIHDWTGVKEETGNGPPKMLIIRAVGAQ